MSIANTASRKKLVNRVAVVTAVSEISAAGPTMSRLCVDCWNHCNTLHKALVAPFTAVCRPTQPSTLREMAKLVNQSIQ